jgi:hypothetical protein
VLNTRIVSTKAFDWIREGFNMGINDLERPDTQSWVSQVVDLRKTGQKNQLIVPTDIAIHWGG